jgi:hypothetical protein
MSESGAGGSLDPDEGTGQFPWGGGGDGDDEGRRSEPAGPGTGSPGVSEPSSDTGTEDSSGGSPGHKFCMHQGCKCGVDFDQLATSVFRFICAAGCEGAPPVVTLADDHSCGCGHRMCIR